MNKAPGVPNIINTLEGLSAAVTWVIIQHGTRLHLLCYSSVLRDGAQI